MRPFWLVQLTRLDLLSERVHVCDQSRLGILCVGSEVVFFGVGFGICEDVVDCPEALEQDGEVSVVECDGAHFGL